MSKRAIFLTNNDDTGKEYASTTIADPAQTFTIRLDMTDSNPLTWGTMVEGTVTSLSPGGGENEIDTFMGYYPCVLKSGIEGKKIKPNNYKQYEDGTAVADSDGDVMVYFPSRGYKISWYDSTHLDVSITSDPNKLGYSYCTYNDNSCLGFYLGVYEGYTSDNKLHSWSGKTPTVNQTIGTFRTQAQANGTNYEQRTYDELVYLQCCALIKYKGNNMQDALGRGFVDNNSAAATTGGTDLLGLNYGETTGQVQMKLFGIEDFWGNILNYVDGIYSDSSYNILTADGNFNDTGSGYSNQGSSGFTSGNGGAYLSRPKATTTKMGFVPDFTYYNTGSVTTFFCDLSSIFNSRLGSFGGHWNTGDSAGLFRLTLYPSDSHSDSKYGTRLTYFKVVTA